MNYLNYRVGMFAATAFSWIFTAISGGTLKEALAIVALLLTFATLDDMGLLRDKQP